MATTIAISGKGGSGKTTLAALMVRALIGRSQKAILAVDADPNSCLGRTLGVEPEIIIAELRENALQRTPNSAGMDRPRAFEYGIQQAVTEAKGFDLIAMGRPEGPGCYCAVNNLLRKFLDDLSASYGFVVMDNEAGMEHLSRRTTNNIDVLFIVAEATALGVLTAERIAEAVRKLPISVGEYGVVWNRAENGRDLEGLGSFGHVPYDEVLMEASMRGQSILEIGQDSRAFSAVLKILDEKLQSR